MPCGESAGFPFSLSLSSINRISNELVVVVVVGASSSVRMGVIVNRICMLTFARSAFDAFRSSKANGIPTSYFEPI